MSLNKYNIPEKYREQFEKIEEFMEILDKLPEEQREQFVELIATFLKIFWGGWEIVAEQVRKFLKECRKRGIKRLEELPEGRIKEDVEKLSEGCKESLDKLLQTYWGEVESNGETNE